MGWNREPRRNPRLQAALAVAREAGCGVICLNRLPGGSRKRRERDLLQDARFLLGKMLALHVASVRIGQLEAVADTGVLRDEIEQARQLIENADRLSARIDRELMEVV